MPRGKNLGSEFPVACYSLRFDMSYNISMIYNISIRYNISIYLKQIERNNSDSPTEFVLHTWLFILALYFALKFAVRTNTP